MEFNAKLRLLRTARGMTQQDLAEKSGVPNNLLSLMETGRILPAGPWDQAIRQALEWPENDDVFAMLAARNGG